MCRGRGTMRSKAGTILRVFLSTVTSTLEVKERVRAGPLRRVCPAGPFLFGVVPTVSEGTVGSIFGWDFSKGFISQGSICSSKVPTFLSIFAVLHPPGPSSPWGPATGSWALLYGYLLLHACPAPLHRTAALFSDVSTEQDEDAH